MSQIDASTQNQGSTPKNSHHPQYLTCGILCLGGILGGTVTGWSSPALPSIKSSGEFPNLNTTSLSWIASIAMLGTLLGSPIGGFMIRKLGRKSTLFYTSFPFTLGWVILAFPLEIRMLYVGRFLIGAALGVQALAGSVYLSEIAEPDIRGSLGVIWFAAIRLGVLFDYGIGALVPHNQLSLISVGLSIAFGLSILFLPESPRWLMTKWRRQKAIDSLCWLRACDKVSPSSKILGEIEEIQEAVVRAEKERNAFGFFSYFTNGVVFKSTMIASLLMAFKEACGGTVYSYYAVQTFDKTGSALDSHVSGVVIGVAQLIGILFTTYYVDKLGRKILLIASFIIMSTSLIFIGLLYHFQTEISSVIPYPGWMNLIAFVFYHTAYSGGPFVLAWAVMSEVIPTNVIGSVSGLVTSVGWLSAFLWTRYYEDVNISIGFANTFLVFAGLSGVSAVCIYILVPETGGKSLEKIHHDCNSNKNNRNDRDHTKL